MLENLEKSGAVSDDIVAHFELQFVSVLSKNERPNLAIYRKIAQDPTLFADLVAWVYQRDDGQRDITHNEQAIRISSAICAEIIFAKGEIPGRTKDGNVDYETLSTWVTEVRRLCAERGRAEIGDDYIGRLLAMSPDGENGIWPCAPVRELLEQLLATGAQHIGNGFVSGTHSIRGVTMRAAFAGGGQERAGC